MSVGNATNGKTYSFISSAINLKSTGDNLIMSTFATEKFVPVAIGYFCVSATAANGDSVINIGWTAPNYNDYLAAGSIGVLTADTSVNNTAVGPNVVFPAATDIYLRVTTADTGTAISVKAIITGYIIS